MSEILGYPLCWPVGWPRTKSPIPSKFDNNGELTLARARNELVAEIQRMGGRQIVISTDIPLTKSGVPASGRRAPEDKGVAVYFTLHGQPKVFACDKWTRIMDNMRAIRKTIEAIRGIERWGSSEIMDRIYRGFQALPEKATYSDSSWWAVLGVEPDADSETVKAAFHKLVKANHSDIGGDPEMFQKINLAYEEAKQHFKNNGEPNYV